MYRLLQHRCSPLTRLQIRSHRSGSRSQRSYSDATSEPAAAWHYSPTLSLSFKVISVENLLGGSRMHGYSQAGTYGSLPRWTNVAHRFQSVSANKPLIKTEGCMISSKRDQPLFYFLCLHGNVGVDRYLTWQPSQSP